jgi:hypothetical protein
MTFFPKIFFLLFCLFHVYHFANPYGFGYTALAVTACFMGHSMFFFWHRYELPAVALGYVTVDRPRRIITTPSLVEARPQQQQQQQQQQQTIPGVAEPAMMTPATPLIGMTTPLRNISASRSLLQEPSTANTNTNANAIANANNNIPLRGEALLFGATSQASFSSSSQRTASGVFRTNPPDGEDDDDSFVYFMEGEVVLRRNSTNQRQQSRSNGSIANNVAAPDVTNTPITTNITTTNTTTITTNNNSTASIGLNVEEDDYEDDQQTTPPMHPLAVNVDYSSLHQQQQQQLQIATTSAAPYSEESGGLQAILEMRLTPRHRNSASNGNPNQQSNGTPDTVEPRRSPPPTFPMLPS